MHPGMQANVLTHKHTIQNDSLHPQKSVMCGSHTHESSERQMQALWLVLTHQKSPHSHLFKDVSTPLACLQTLLWTRMIPPIPRGGVVLNISESQLEYGWPLVRDVL